MKSVALTAGSPCVDVRVVTSFGSSALLLFVDPDTMAWESVENPDWDTRDGAGLRAAQILSARKVSDVVSGGFEPKARDAVQSAGVVPHRCDCGTKVRQAVTRLKAGELPEDFWR